MLKKILAAGMVLTLALASVPPAWSAPVDRRLTMSSASSADLSVEDLGFSVEETTGDPKLQKDLETRADMLRIHQVLGLTTAAVMTTQYVIGYSTTDDVTNGNTDTTLHAALGIGTVALYGSTAMFAILAPKPKGLKPSGATELHEVLMWVHAPLMILTPILGAMTNDRIARHQPHEDLGELHGLAATALLASYLAAMSVELFNF